VGVDLLKRGRLLMGSGELVKAGATFAQAREQLGKAAAKTRLADLDYSLGELVERRKDCAGAARHY
jgi:hypothetical protein